MGRCRNPQLWWQQIADGWPRRCAVDNSSRDCRTDQTLRPTRKRCLSPLGVAGRSSPSSARTIGRKKRTSPISRGSALPAMEGLTGFDAAAIAHNQHLADVLQTRPAIPCRGIWRIDSRPLRAGITSGRNRHGCRLSRLAFNPCLTSISYGP